VVAVVMAQQIAHTQQQEQQILVEVEAVVQVDITLVQEVQVL
jgi:hypothetical protein